jgi:hypothetical protein
MMVNVFISFHRFILRNAYMIFVGKPERRRPLGKPGVMWVDNIKMDLRQIGWGGMDWIGLAQDSDQGSCEESNEPSGSLKCWKILE